MQVHNFHASPYCEKRDWSIIPTRPGLPNILILQDSDALYPMSFLKWSQIYLHAYLNGRPICIHQYESNITSCLPVYTEIFFRVVFSSRANKAFTVKLIHLFLLFPNSQIRCMEGASFIYNHTLSRKKSVTITFFHVKYLFTVYFLCS